MAKRVTSADAEDTLGLAAAGTLYEDTAATPRDRRDGRRRIARAVLSIAATLGVLLATSGCTIASGSFPPSGAEDPAVVTAREQAASEQEILLTTTAMSEPISTSVQDYCETGSYSEPWGPRDPYYWSCGRVTSWVVGTETHDPAELIMAYRARLISLGCEPSEADFEMTARYWEMYGIPGENANGERYTVDDLPGAGGNCEGGAWVGIGFGSAAEFDASTLVTYYASDGEKILDQPHDESAVHALGSALIVTLSTRTEYHYVPRGGSEPSPSTTPEPLHCACYSGSQCDCPGG